MQKKITTIQRAYDIVSTSNPKFHWKYKILENGDYKLYFWCDECYRCYKVQAKILNPEQLLATMSNLIELMKQNGFEKVEEAPC